MLSSLQDSLQVGPPPGPGKDLQEGFRHRHPPGQRLHHHHRQSVLMLEYQMCTLSSITLHFQDPTLGVRCPVQATKTWTGDTARRTVPSTVSVAPPNEYRVCRKEWQSIHLFAYNCPLNLAFKFTTIGSIIIGLSVKGISIVYCQPSGQSMYYHWYNGWPNGWAF